MSYSSHVLPSYRVVDASRAMIGGVPTPLTDVVAPLLSVLPGDIQQQLKRDFWKRHDAATPPGFWLGDWSEKYAAQDWLTNEVEEFKREKVDRAFDESEVRQLAKRWADLCSRMCRLEPMQDFARSVGIDPPEVGRIVSRVGGARRLSCPRWWRKAIRKHYTRRAESHLRAAGFVHRKRQVYASDRAVAYRRERKQRDSALMKELVAVSDAGDQLPLFDIVEASQSNPALRRAELMVRARGFEEVAEFAGHAAEFWTLTTPSAFHCMHSNGTKNEKWEGFTPRQGQEWLSKMWARARAKLKRLAIRIYGFRIAEPHHDGTPHWHLLLFMPSQHVATVRKIISNFWVSEYANEAGANQYRSKVIAIDRAKGSAAGYIAKYVAKNIDGFSVGDDYETEGQGAAQTVDRVAAWASAHGIRQFQQVGGPAVTVWRELRRLRAANNYPLAVEQARQAADAGEWAAFIAALGGIEVGRKGRVTLWAEVSGEINQYDELRAAQIVGVEGPGLKLPASVLTDGIERTAAEVRALAVPYVARIRTRTKVWRIQRKAESNSEQLLRADSHRGAGMSPCSSSSLGPVSITVRDLKNVPADAIAGNGKNQRVRGSPWTH